MQCLRSLISNCGRGQLKCDGTRAETGFLLSAKWTSTFILAGASVQSTTGSRGVRISGSNAGYTMFRGSVKRTGFPLHSPISPSLLLPCVTVCHHISTEVYLYTNSFVPTICNISPTVTKTSRPMTPASRDTSKYFHISPSNCRLTATSNSSAHSSLFHVT